MRYLFLINVGPVQSFIKTARRTRDLWYGSWLLSELSKMAAATVVQAGGKLIFPAIDEHEQLQHGSELNVVNHVLAVLRDRPDQLGDLLTKNLHKLLEDEWATARMRVGGWLDNDEQAHRQVLDLLELMWVYAPLVESDYRGSLSSLEKLMASRKNTRNFQPVTWGSSKPKSSLDGLRESVIPEAAYPKESDKAERERKAVHLYQQYGAGHAERLSGVDLLKRHGNHDAAARVPSTSDIAARPFLERLARDPTRYTPALSELFDKLSDLSLKALPRPPYTSASLRQLDAQLLYPSRLRTDFQEFRLPETNVEEAIQALNSFYARLNREQPVGTRLEPGAYYCLLVADGDNMAFAVTFFTMAVNTKYALTKTPKSTVARMTSCVISIRNRKNLASIPPRM